MLRALLIGGMIAVTGCAALPQGPTHLTGSWGGPHAGLILEGGIGTILFDCAAGTLDAAIFPAVDGRFTAPGTYRAGASGPVRAGQIFVSERATYSGTLEGEQLTLAVTLENGTALGPFTLTRGAAPQLTRCL